MADSSHWCVQGYVDDSRNTDNAWFETVATHYHDHLHKAFHKILFKTADSSLQFVWREVTPELPLRQSHLDFVKQVCADAGVSEFGTDALFVAGC